MPDKPGNDEKLTIAEQLVLAHMKEHQPALHRAYEDGRISFSTTRRPEMDAPVVTAHSREIVKPQLSKALTDRLRARQSRSNDNRVQTPEQMERATQAQMREYVEINHPERLPKPEPQERQISLSLSNALRARQHITRSNEND